MVVMCCIRRVSRKWCSRFSVMDRRQWRGSALAWVAASLWMRRYMSSGMVLVLLCLRSEMLSLSWWRVGGRWIARCLNSNLSMAWDQMLYIAWRDLEVNSRTYRLKMRLDNQRW
jgi:hypothetical protein